MTSKERVDIKISLLKKPIRQHIAVLCFFVWNLILFCVVFVATPFLILESSETIDYGILLFSIFAMGFLALPAVLSMIMLSKLTKLKKTLQSLDVNKSERKEVFCYKYTYLTCGRTRHTRDTIGLCVYTVHGKYYYVFDSAIAYGTKRDFKDLYSGDHEFEIYKDTNVIKSFPAADKVLNIIPPYRFV